MNYSTLLDTLRYIIKPEDLAKREEDFGKLYSLFDSHAVDVEDLVDIIYRVSPNCSDIVVDCQWCLSTK